MADATESTDGQDHFVSTRSLLFEHSRAIKKRRDLQKTRATPKSHLTTLAPLLGVVPAHAAACSSATCDSSASTHGNDHQPGPSQPAVPGGGGDASTEDVEDDESPDHVDAGVERDPSLYALATLTSSSGTLELVGDRRLAAIRKMFAIIDDRGFERSPNQVKFHEAFLRASGRCIYKEEWGVHRRAIMERNRWFSDCSEILVSTPRRFGKTFSIAMFCAALSVVFGVTISCFSPSARGSRSILERMYDFVQLLGFEKSVVTYNQENLKIKAMDGRYSLLRSFPSKIDVRASLEPHRVHARRTCASHTHTHTRTHTHTHTHTPMARQHQRTHPVFHLVGGLYGRGSVMRFKFNWMYGTMSTAHRTSLQTLHTIHGFVVHTQSAVRSSASLVLPSDRSHRIVHHSSKHKGSIKCAPGAG